MSKKKAKIEKHETNNWIEAKDLHVGKHVQKVIVRGVPVFDVVDVGFCINLDSMVTHVYDINTREEVNPLIVCHALYQKIQEI
jgi:gluconate kinase